MANRKISELPDADLPIQSGVKFEAVQNGQNVKVDADDMPGSGGAGAVDSVNGQTGDVVLDATDIEVTPTGNLSAINVQAALAELDSDITAGLAGLKWKNSVRVATTVSGTLASDFENGDSVDGITLATGNRILLKNQSDQTQNGIYTVNASGAPTRSTDADAAAELESAAVTVDEGTTNANTTWLQITDSITLGVSNIVWTQYGSSVPDADETTKGIVERATDAETAAGSDTTRFISPASLKATEGPVVHSTSTLTITDAHHKKTLIFTVNCTVTVPTGLRADLKFDAFAGSGVTLVEFDIDGGITYYALNNANALRSGQAASFIMQSSNTLKAVFGLFDHVEETLLVTADVSSSVITAADIGGLTTTLDENSTYTVDGQIVLGCNNTGGVKFGVVSPTGAEYRFILWGVSTAATAYTRGILTADGLGATLYCTVNSAGAGAHIRFAGTIHLEAGEGGTFKIQFASGTGGQTSTVYSVGSFLTIKKQI